MKRLYLAADHGGFSLKNNLITFLRNQFNSFEVIDLGTDTDQSVDYPDFAQKLCQEVLQDEANLGILLCGTGIGMSIAANRYQKIRAALVYDEFTAKMAKAHNNANVLVLGGRTTSPDLAEKLVTIWLKTEFEGQRHLTRINKADN